MSQSWEHDTKGAGGGGRGQEPAGRRPYEPPGITFREPLETLAVVCTTGPGNPGKAGPGVGTCIIGAS